MTHTSRSKICGLALTCAKERWTCSIRCFLRMAISSSSGGGSTAGDKTDGTDVIHVEFEQGAGSVSDDLKEVKLDG